MVNIATDPAGLTAPKGVSPPREQETDERFYIADSTIPGAGKGLFAKVPLARGDRLEVIGVLVLAESIADRCTAYADDHKFRVGDHVLIPLGFGGMANHSLQPNLEKVVEGERVYLQVIRPVDAGAELFFCYQPSARQRLGLAPIE